MAKKASTTSAPVAEVNEQKKRKQQAKREAKMMLEIEETKVSIEMHISARLRQIYLSFAHLMRKLK